MWAPWGRHVLLGHYNYGSNDHTRNIRHKVEQVKSSYRDPELHQFGYDGKEKNSKKKFNKGILPE